MMWLPKRVVEGWGKVTQVMMSRTARQVWLLAAFSMLLVWLYSYSTVNPTEPYLKRFHSSTTGGEGVAVIFANKQVDTITNDTHNYASHLAGRSYAPAASAQGSSSSISRDGVRVKEIPFSSEKQFDLSKQVFRRLNSTNSLPPDKEEIPAGILRMIADIQNSTGESGPPRQIGQKNPQFSKDKLQSPVSPQEKKPGGHNIPDWVRSIFSPGSANQHASSNSLEGTNTHETNNMDSDLGNIDESQLVMIAETGINKMEQTDRANKDELVERSFLFPEIPNVIDEENENSVDMDDEGIFRKRVHFEGKPKDHDHRATNTQTGTHGNARMVADKTFGRNSAEFPENTVYRAMRNGQNHWPDLEHRNHPAVQDNMLDIDQLSELLDPDDPFLAWDVHPDSRTPSNIQQLKESLLQSSGVSATNKPAKIKTFKQPDSKEPAEVPVPASHLDVFSSTERVPPLSFHLHKRKRLTGKILSAAHTADKTDAESVNHKSPITGDHENKKVKKLLHNTHKDQLFILPDDQETSPSPDVQQRDVVNDKNYVHDHKITDKSKNAISLSDNTKPGTKLSDTFEEEHEKKHSELTIHNQKSELNITLWKSVLKERKRLLRAKCQDDALISKQNIQDTKTIVDRKRNFLYCPVGESAPGFFYRLMFSLKNNNRSAREFPSPFDIPLQEALAEEFETVSRFHRKGLDEFMTNSLRFVVVRDPFSRLFAAYVDRLLVPDSGYWKKWGIPAITKHRKYPSAKSLACGHDVTFAEFVKYVISTIHADDDIVKPVNTLCAPCDLRFSVIGHVETLVSDIEYVLSLLKLSIGNFTAETFMSDVNDDIISESAFKAFGFYEQLNSCISKYELGKRLWRNLQIHGIISEELTFSFAPKKVEKMTPLEFMKLVHEAREVLPDSEKVRQQKTEALKTAFENVSAEDIMQIVKIYGLDFELFGFDRHPSFLS